MAHPHAARGMPARGARRPDPVPSAARQASATSWPEQCCASMAQRPVLRVSHPREQPLSAASIAGLPAAVLSVVCCSAVRAG